jgi:hypothetical protein
MKIKAIVVSNVLDIIGTNLAAVIAGALMIGSAKLFHDSLPEKAIGYLSDPFSHKLVFQILGMGCSVLAGYLAARMAKEKELLYGASSAILCTGLGVFAIVKSHQYDAKTLLMEPVSIVLGTLGGYLRLRTMKRPEAESNAG